MTYAREKAKTNCVTCTKILNYKLGHIPVNEVP